MDRITITDILSYAITVFLLLVTIEFIVIFVGVAFIELILRI